MLTQTFLKYQQHLQSYQENSCHACVPHSAGWGASFASQHWLKSTLIFLYQLPVSSSTTQFPSSLWSRKEGEKPFALFLSSLQSWLTVVSVSSVVLQWCTRFWGAEVAAGQCIKDMMSKAPSRCSPCAPQGGKQSCLFLFFTKAVYWWEKQEREGRWNEKRGGES